jgi:hypothetical protein
MSAAFQLDFTGPQTRCDFPGCVLDSFHDGDHLFAKSPVMPIASAAHKIAVARENGAHSVTLSRSEWTALWLKDNSRPTEVPILCTCAQRPYPHEVTVHDKIGIERPGVYLDYYDTAIRFAPEGMRWPWSLRRAPKMEA